MWCLVTESTFSWRSSYTTADTAQPTHHRDSTFLTYRYSARLYKWCGVQELVSLDILSEIAHDANNHIGVVTLALYTFAGFIMDYKGSPHWHSDWSSEYNLPHYSPSYTVSENWQIMATKAKIKSHQNRGVGQLVFASLSASLSNQVQDPPFAIQGRSKTNQGP